MILAGEFASRPAMRPAHAAARLQVPLFTHVGKMSHCGLPNGMMHDAC